ncbi:MAG: radical SAM protein, partial [Alistipes sp.]|nr:radical SAM protein [Alistipes sp.]
FQHHFHIPLQSGSDSVLARMRRRYTTARFAERIEAVRRRMPDAFIGIDIIVGFPGETEEDFRTTCDFLERITPAYLHIFPFSERPGTPAVDFPDKVPPSEATRRVEALEALCRRLHGSFCAQAEGTTDEVLFESTMRGGMMFGYTGNYRRVKAPYDRSRINTICRVRLGKMDPETFDLEGEIIG